MPTMPFPPSVPGVTGGIPSPDPMRMLAMLLSPPSMTGMAHLLEAIASLRRAGQEDARIESKVGDAIRLLTQGDEDRRHMTPRPSGGGQPIVGPSPAVSLSGPR